MIMEDLNAMEREFENKVAVVTGGAKGIRKCICGEFEKQGAKVCGWKLEE